MMRVEEDGRAELVEKFIAGMRNEGTVKVFTEGYCYWFAAILEGRFGGEMYYEPVLNHFAVKIDGVLWDIEGEVQRGDRWQAWWLYMMNEPADADRVIRNCIKKDEYERK